MQTIKLPHTNAHTFRTNLFGRGLNDDRFRVQRFQSMSDGEICPRRCNGPSKKVRGKVSGEIVSLRTFQRIRPARDELRRVHRVSPIPS